ncbi:MAG: PLP-dependent aminotransferase family protein, partial [Acidobacteria bacterium]|nr:PLP-dependent aminotransferase family protein [Acidobacteriota bacterium]
MKKQNDHAPFIMLDESGDSLPLYRQIYEAIRNGILGGDFAPSMRIPSSREMAKGLGVSRITVVNAYEQLFAEGYLEGITGAGTFVASELPEDLLQTKNASSTKTSNSPLDISLRLSYFGERLRDESEAAGRDRSGLNARPFQNGLTAVDEFPFEVWSKVAAKYYRSPPHSILGYGDAQGFPPLREAIAVHLRSARGVNCTAEQIIITSGAQQALDLTARIFLSARDVALVEDPCYPEVKSLFAAADADIVSVEVDEEGFDPGKIPDRAEKAKLVYVTPSHQFPLGVTMSLPRRLALLDWVKSRNAWIIEDDYNSEFRYAGRPLASLQGLDKTGRVLYIGTFSKTIFPTLRIGCIVV